MLFDKIYGFVMLIMAGTLYPYPESSLVTSDVVWANVRSGRACQRKNFLAIVLHFLQNSGNDKSGLRIRKGRLLFVDSTVFFYKEGKRHSLSVGWKRNPIELVKILIKGGEVWG